jgi:hypothetical protein
MKITKSKLKEMIREEIKSLREISSSVGTTADIKRQKAAKSNTASKRVAKNKKQTSKKSAKATWDTAKSDYATKLANYNTKQSDYVTRKNTHTTKLAAEPVKYQWTVRGRLQTGATVPREADRGSDSVRSQWTTWNTEKASTLSARDAAELARDTALSDKNTASSKRDSDKSKYDVSVSDFNTAVSNLSSAEKAELLAFATSRGYTGGAAGGFGSGKGSSGKGKGGKNSNKKKKT